MLKAKGSEFDKIFCPYQCCHQIERYRLAKHLIVCKKRNAKLPLFECPFNITHMHNKVELDNHVLVCPDRKSYESFKYNMVPSNSVPAPVAEMPEIETSENWDEQPHVSAYDPKSYAEKAPVLRTCNNAPPLERKVFRKTEHLRLKGIEN